jgi:hypothetical protein
VFPQTKVLSALSPCKPTKNLIHILVDGLTALFTCMKRLELAFKLGFNIPVSLEDKKGGGGKVF